MPSLWSMPSQIHQGKRAALPPASLCYSVCFYTMETIIVSLISIITSPGSQQAVKVCLSMAFSGVVFPWFILPSWPSCPISSFLFFQHKLEGKSTFCFHFFFLFWSLVENSASSLLELQRRSKGSLFLQRCFVFRWRMEIAQTSKPHDTSHCPTLDIKGIDPEL